MTGDALVLSCAAFDELPPKDAAERALPVALWENGTPVYLRQIPAAQQLMVVEKSRAILAQRHWMR
eukprot:3887261-Rhodomonas_salina.1